MCEWVRANGLDPDKIDEGVEVVNGDTIRYREIAGDRNGSPIWVDRSTPLVSDFPVDEYRLSTR